MKNEPSLAEVYPQEMDRIKYLIKEYQKIPQGRFGEIMLTRVLTFAKKAWNEQDVVKMLDAYYQMKECK